MQKGRGKGLVFFAKCNVILVEFQLKETQFRQCLETEILVEEYWGISQNARLTMALGLWNRIRDGELL